MKKLPLTASLLGILLVTGFSSPVLAIDFDPASAVIQAPSRPKQDQSFHDPFDNDSDKPSKEKVKVNDPLEKMNRGLFTFNDRLYFWFLKPVATGYKTVAPKPFREHFALFFQNAKYPVRFVNALLQGRFKSAGIETGRFVVNTTVGLGGFFDTASKFKMEAQPGDFDQTLGKWHLPTGPYIVWPLLGPSSVRDTFGIAGDSALSPLLYIHAGVWAFAARPTEIINTNSLRLGEYEAFKKANLDPYVSMRSLYFEYWNSRDSGETGDKPAEKLKR